MLEIEVKGTFEYLLSCISFSFVDRNLLKRLNYDYTCCRVTADLLAKMKTALILCRAPFS